MSGSDPINFTDSGTTAKTAAYTLTSNDFVVHVDATGGAFSVTMPAAAAAYAGRMWVVMQNTSSANQVTVKTGGGTINGAAAGTGVAITGSKIGPTFVFCDGTNFYMGSAFS